MYMLYKSSVEYILEVTILPSVKFSCALGFRNLFFGVSEKFVDSFLIIYLCIVLCLENIASASIPTLYISL